LKDWEFQISLDYLDSLVILRTGSSSDNNHSRQNGLGCFFPALVRKLDHSISIPEQSPSLDRLCSGTKDKFFPPSMRLLGKLIEGQKDPI
jgi:hypothetical protein